MEQQGIDALAGVRIAADALASTGGLQTGLSGSSNACAEPAVLLHADWRRELRRTIVQRVLPRLSSASGSPPEVPRPSRAAAFSDEAVERFADAALSTGTGRLLATVEASLASGVMLDSVFLDLLAPAARRLGDMWLADRLSFFDVTAGLGRLQSVVRALGPDFERYGTGHGGRILLSPAAGEQHVFGLSIVAAFFRRAGWDVTFEPVGVEDELIARVRSGAFDAIGLSAAGDGAVSRLPGQIEAIRRASGPHGIPILVGGPAFLADPGLGRRVGADAVARDATEAVRLADAFQRRAVAA